jgi:hypothetical protein
MRTDRRCGFSGTFALATWLAGSALAQTAPDAPLSAIDWLSQSVTTPPTAAAIPPVSKGSVPEEVSVTVLGGPSADAAGLLSPQVTGLPQSLWGIGRREDIIKLVANERADTLPALRSLLLTLLLAEADPPADSQESGGGTGALLLARVDKLLDLGALEQARALLDVAGPERPDLFRRSFDVDLLTGNEDQGCKTMVAAPGLAPTFPARIFCLARSGDWNAAALTLRTGQALGFVTDQEDALLSRFLDPDLYEGEPPLIAPQPVTPLDWRMFEAIGEPLPTSTLPLAFAHAELRPTAGWKAQIEAAERLARAGAISPNLLLGLYTERKPAASGGVWDRVAAFQRFEAALSANDPRAIERALPEVWARMTEAELEVPFAEIYGERLRTMDLPGDAGQIAFQIGLLSPSYEQVANDRTTTDLHDRFLIGLARGQMPSDLPPDSLARAIAPAFDGTAPSETMIALLDQTRLGEALLLAIKDIELGVQGDLPAVTDGLALLRRVGMETIARRTALELVLLERRG